MKRILLLCFLFPIGQLLAGKERLPQTPLPDIAKLLANTTELQVYEGLPHPMFESRALEEEKRNKKVFSIDGSFFYEKKLPVPETDLASLDRAFYADNLLKRYVGRKLCGGFHADYLVTWLRKDGAPTHALVCFGCSEIMFSSEGITSHADLTQTGHESLRAILGKYRQELPNKIVSEKMKSEPMPAPKVPIEIALPTPTP